MEQNSKYASIWEWQVCLISHVINLSFLYIFWQQVVQDRGAWRLFKEVYVLTEESISWKDDDGDDEQRRYIFWITFYLDNMKWANDKFQGVERLKKIKTVTYPQIPSQDKLCY